MPYSVTTRRSEEKRSTLAKAEWRFKKACNQIVHLNHHLENFQKRYKEARDSNHRPIRYKLRLRLAVIEGVRDMYYEYAYAKANQISELRRQLFGERVQILTSNENQINGNSTTVQRR